MKRNVLLVLSIVTLLLSLLALTAFAEGDIARHRDCKHCGMDRKAYGYSRMLVEYKDGTQVGVCSLHCVVTEQSSNPQGEIVSLQVADRDTRELIDAKKAVWVIGGSKRGVMTKVGKWAFTEKTAAETFIKANGGKLATFDEAFKAAKKERDEKADSKKDRQHKEHKM